MSWIEYDDIHELISYNGTGWGSYDGYSKKRGNATKTHTSPNDSTTIEFYFIGTGLRVYGAGYADMNTSNKITIDGVDYEMKRWSEITTNVVDVSFSIETLQYKAHKVIISYNGSSRIYLDGLDVLGSLCTREEYESFINNIDKTQKSSTYQLPMNTTQAILAKTNDTREGLMGMANDVENYGDLYVVGKDGKSHLTKAGIKSEVIFEGKANTISIYSLLNSISKYKHIIVQSESVYQNAIYNKTSTIIPSENSDTLRTINGMNYVGSNVYGSSIDFKINNDKIEIVSIVLNLRDSAYISKIIGIY